MDVIQHKLSTIEQSNHITILFAIESGSRAWNYATEKSDYDIRGVFCYKPEKYMSITSCKEEIKCNVDDKYDYVLWDIRKFIRLFQVSNLSVYEFVHSPIVYLNRDNWLNKFKELVIINFDKPSLESHYFNMFKGNYHTHFRDLTKVSPKKYLNVIRGYLCYLSLTNGILPLNRIEEMLDYLDLSLVKFTNNVLELKKQGSAEPLNLPTKINDILVKRMELKISTIKPKIMEDEVLDQMVYEIIMMYI